MSGSVVVSQDQCGLTERGEGPGEGKVLKTVWSCARDGQRTTFFLCYILYNESKTHTLLPPIDPISLSSGPINNFN